MSTKFVKCVTTAKMAPSVLRCLPRSVHAARLLGWRHLVEGLSHVPVLCLLLAANAPAAAPAKPGVAVTEVRAIHGIEPSLAQVLNEVLLARLKESGVFSSVIGGSDIAAMVDIEQQKAALGCDDTNCLAELGGASWACSLFSAARR